MSHLKDIVTGVRRAKIVAGL